MLRNSEAVFSTCGFKRRLCQNQLRPNKDADSRASDLDLENGTPTLIPGCSPGCAPPPRPLEDNFQSLSLSSPGSGCGYLTCPPLLGPLSRGAHLSRSGVSSTHFQAPSLWWSLSPIQMRWFFLAFQTVRNFWGGVGGRQEEEP